MAYGCRGSGGETPTTRAPRKGRHELPVPLAGLHHLYIAPPPSFKKSPSNIGNSINTSNSNGNINSSTSKSLNQCRVSQIQTDVFVALKDVLEQQTTEVQGEGMSVLIEEPIKNTNYVVDMLVL